MTRPPGNSLEQAQGEHVVDPGGDLASGLLALLARIGDEVDFNDAKGTSPYRLGMHDGLRFAQLRYKISRGGAPLLTPPRVQPLRIRRIRERPQRLWRGRLSDPRHEH